jgi:hydrogenase maturation protein HypF
MIPTPLKDMNVVTRKRVRLKIEGLVQGVGFRPFVCRLAHQLRLDGWIRNTPEGALVEIEGMDKELKLFQRDLIAEAPPAAKIQRVTIVTLSTKKEQGFSIRPTQPTGQRKSIISPDMATCTDCLREMHDPQARRFRYPFTTCTRCGPRYSIALDLPYDRVNTSMRGFPLCHECQLEYDDMGNRRFHAETMSCPVCGPQITLLDRTGRVCSRAEHALGETCTMIRQGNILALKGLGGFQLLVDAFSQDAVQKLRIRKHRPRKPFAVLFPSLSSVREHCLVTQEEETLLTSAEAPIVLLKKRFSGLTLDIAPDNPYIGAMMPYTPLHHLLMAELQIPIVATSGNRSEEPLVTDEIEALTRLEGIADAFLVHNLPIARPVDDSVSRIVSGERLLLRRARGYVPNPLSLETLRPEQQPVAPILAVGGYLKNTVSVTTPDQAITSQHIGDLSTAAAHLQFERTVSDQLRWFNIQPAAIACDLHPDYPSTLFANRLGKQLNIPVIRVQHHHAHITSCMAEHGLKEPVLGIAWDGAGYGSDRTIWGGEFLLCDYTGFRRVATLRQFRLPGGDICMREPRRVALSLLYEVFGEKASRITLPSLTSLGSPLAASLVALLEKNINCPATTSMGRLFDGMSSILGLRHLSTFEGEAAMALEFASEHMENQIPYSTQTAPMPLMGNPDDTWIVDWRPHIREIVQGCLHGKSVSQMAAEFHRYLTDLILQVAEKEGCPIVVLAGGVFQNAQLTSLAKHRLRSLGYRVYTNTQFPTNDGGLSIGQALIAQHNY